LNDPTTHAQLIYGNIRVGLAPAAERARRSAAGASEGWGSKTTDSSPIRGDRPLHTTAILIRRATDGGPSRFMTSRADAIHSSRLVLTPERFTRSRLDRCERLSRRRRKLRTVVKIVVPRVDGALKDQVPDRSAQSNVMGWAIALQAFPDT